MLGPELAILRVVEITSMPTMSAGSMSGVNCSRLERTQAMQLANVFSASVFGQPRHTFQQHVAVGEQGDQKRVEKMCLTDDDAAYLLVQRPDPS